MVTIPPPYEPNSSPPAYDKLVDRVGQMVGSDPTQQKYIDAAASLTDDKINILMDGGDFSDPFKTDEDNKIFSSGAAKGLASPECTKHLRDTASAAVDAASEISRLFVTLYLKIAQIDRIHRSNFKRALIENQRVGLLLSVLLVLMLFRRINKSSRRVECSQPI